MRVPDLKYAPALEGVGAQIIKFRFCHKAAGSPKSWSRRCLRLRRSASLHIRRVLFRLARQWRHAGAKTPGSRDLDLVHQRKHLFRRDAMPALVEEPIKTVASHKTCHVIRCEFLHSRLTKDLVRIVQEGHSGDGTKTGADLALRAFDEPRFACPVFDMSAYGHVPDPDIFRFLLAACVRKRPVDVTYRSKTRTFITRFSPHTLVRTAHRMHFRGYSIIGDGRPGFYWDLRCPHARVVKLEAPRDDYVDLSGDIESV